MYGGMVGSSLSEFAHGFFPRKRLSRSVALAILPHRIFLLHIDLIIGYWLLVIIMDSWIHGLLQGWQPCLAHANNLRRPVADDSPMRGDGTFDRFVTASGHCSNGLPAKVDGILLFFIFLFFFFFFPVFHLFSKDQLAVQGIRHYYLSDRQTIGRLTL